MTAAVRFFKDVMKKGSSSGKRRGWIDYARGIAIILVVYRHVMVGLESSGMTSNDVVYYIQEGIYNIRMPLFFVLSGIFIHKSLKRRGLGDFALYKVDTILYPYLVWAFIHLSMQIASLEYTNTPKSFNYYINILIAPRALDQFWFLYTLFFTVMLYATCVAILKFSKWHLLALALMMYAAAYYYPTRYLALEDILFYFMFLVMGSILSEVFLNSDNSRKLFSGWAILALGLLTIASQWYWLSNYTGLVKFTDLEGLDRYLFVPMAILGCIFIFQLSYLLDKLNLFGLLKVIGSHSLYIYVMHLMVAGGSRALLMTLWPEISFSLAFTIIVLLSVFLPILLYKLSMKINMKFLYEFPAFV